MGSWDQIWDWFRGLLGLSPAPVPEGEPQPQRPRVLAITYNPVIHSEGGRRLREVLAWNDVEALISQYVADLHECSGGLVDYQIVESLEMDAWPVKADGFRYDEESYLACWRTRTGCHEPDAVDYGAIVAEFDLLTRVESGEVDEVWLFAFPFAGFYESIMVGPGAFWCNSPPMPRSDGISRRFLIMGFSYERGVGEMLESFSHRVESHMRQAWRHRHGDENLWERFVRYDKANPGQANCGSVHYAPNSRTDYDWGNMTAVPSNCDDWLSFPNFQGTTRLVDCREWGGGEIRAHHKWWLAHLPKVPGHTGGLSNNWWWYAVDPNAVT